MELLVTSNSFFKYIYIYIYKQNVEELTIETNLTAHIIIKDLYVYVCVNYTEVTHKYFLERRYSLKYA